MALLLLVFATAVGEGAPKQAKAAIAKGIGVRSVNVWMRPGLFGGGFAFYVDNKGNLYLQETNAGGEAKYLERRIVLRNRRDLWGVVQRSVSVQAIMKRTPQEPIIVDAGMYEFAIELENDVVT